MKKTLAYATIAIMLGIATMLAPFLAIPAISPNTHPAINPSTQTGAGNSYRTPESIPRSLSPATTQAEAKQSESSVGIVPNYPVDIVTISLMLAFSLVVAFSAYFYVRHSRLLKNGNTPLQP